MKELLDELEKTVAIDYMKALYNCEQIVNSLNLEYVSLNNSIFCIFNLRVKLNNILNDWFELTNKDFLIFTRFYKILTTNHACYHLLTKSRELYVGKDDKDLFIEKISIDLVSIEDKINIVKNFENVLDKFGNDVILEHKIKI